jgi:23S rRNA pseudouridine1911/1915/1917 synthase
LSHKSCIFSGLSELKPEKNVFYKEVVQKHRTFGTQFPNNSIEKVENEINSMESNNLSVKSRILYQSTACIAVNKLKGEAVEGAEYKYGAKLCRSNMPHSVTPVNTAVCDKSKAVYSRRQRVLDGMADLPGELSAVLGANVELIEAVHRLDVPVTGCVLFALTRYALSFLNAAFTEGSVPSSSVEKIYWVVIEKPSRSLPESGELVHWIETVPGKNKSFAHNKEGSAGKKASLRYRITGEGRNYLFVEVQLLSGRHHQIRAQFAAEGLHIKGDLKYGAKRSEKGGGIRLHARSLSFPDPLDRSKIISVTAAPPEMDNLWEEFMK